MGRRRAGQRDLQSGSETVRDRLARVGETRTRSGMVLALELEEDSISSGSSDIGGLIDKLVVGTNDNSMSGGLSVGRWSYVSCQYGCSSNARS